jgi:outer membrane lipoprotein-sorting protein
MHIYKRILITLMLTASCLTFAAEDKAAAQESEKPQISDDAAAIIKKINQDAVKLKDLSAKIKYQVTFDNGLFESTTTYLGSIKAANTREQSKLLITFDSRQEDELEPEAHHEQFYFDGVWLLRIDHNLKNSTNRQMAAPEKPMGIFELMSQYIPLVALDSMETMTSDFHVTLESLEEGKSAVMTFKPVKGSEYEENYKQLKLTYNLKDCYPAIISGTRADGEEFVIELSEPAINSKDAKPIDIKPVIPNGYSTKTIPLKKDKIKPESGQGE